jgi:hypothetical protein
MKKQAITDKQILAVYAEIQHKDKMAKIAISESLKTAYLAEQIAMWETLQIILGHENISMTFDLVHSVVNNNKAEA